jgi:high frequency lysogenization protein
MTYTVRDQLIALAGICQATLGVQRTARRGSIDEEELRPSVYSLFQTDADDVPAVFGPAGSLIPGAQALVRQLSGTQPRDLELTRYVISLLKLERALSGREDMIEEIRSGIAEAAAKLQHFPMLHPNLLSHLADLYSRTISKMQPRILVKGDPHLLQIPENQNRIRTLLLSGIRSAWLWRQVGGSRWSILFGRKRLLTAAQEYVQAPRN